METKSFKPKTLNELVDFYYDNKTAEIREYELKALLNDDHGKGRFWERVLAKAMSSHTVLLENNAWHRDYADNSDAKFATSSWLSNKSTGTWQATIGNYKSKIGPLRVCLCVEGQHIHKVYFMLIPYEYHSKLSGHPIKITFKNFQPIGKVWDDCQCSWEEVTQKL